ncbi:MAG: glycosyltransferase [Salinivirgaceae bacterium]
MQLTGIMSEKIVFSILHYQAFDMTVKCVEYLKKIINSNHYIVIVDNASPNDSGNFLEKKYATDNNIFIIRNKYNAGFAKGNNLGYIFAKEKLKADCIIVINNDVLIKQANFLSELKTELNNDVHIIAPDIITPLGEHQNPLRLRKISTKKIVQDLIYNLFMTAITLIPLLNKLVTKFLIGRRTLKIKDKVDSNIVLGPIQYIVPHGAAIIYTRKYIEREDFAFLPITFLFAEEDILYEYIRQNNYKTYFSPVLQVEHLHDASIDEITSGEVAKKHFMSKCKYKSLIQLLRVRLFGNFRKSDTVIIC